MLVSLPNPFFSECGCFSDVISGAGHVKRALKPLQNPCVKCGKGSHIFSFALLPVLQ